jgi:hypothetical protein
LSVVELDAIVVVSTDIVLDVDVVSTDSVLDVDVVKFVVILV